MALRAAVVAGLAGSLAMDVVQDAFAFAFEGQREDDDRDEETEAIVAVVRRIAAAAPFVRPYENSGIAGRALHYIFGCGFAVAYERIRRRTPQIGEFGGVLFGLTLWLLSDVVLIPAAHLARPLMRYSRAERINAVLSHVAYAASVETTLRTRDGRK